MQTLPCWQQSLVRRPRCYIPKRYTCVNNLRVRARDLESLTLRRSAVSLFCPALFQQYKDREEGMEFFVLLINPRRACAARVTVVAVSVCLSVCPLSHISPLELLFVLKTVSRTQWATKVKKFVAFSLKPMRFGERALPPFDGHT